LQTDEINKRATDFKAPFFVSRQQVDYYRKSRKINIEAIKTIDEKNALTTGLSLKENRVIKLQQLAVLMEKDLIDNGFLWVEDVKGVGSGMAAQVVDFERFNSAEVEQYRRVLDDIAKETGGRVQKQELTGKDGGAIELTWAEFIKRANNDTNTEGSNQ